VASSIRCKVSFQRWVASVPSIKLPSLGGLGIVQRQRFDHERWRYVHVRMPALKKMAAGGFANFAQNYQIGEAGREAIVPLIAH